MGPDVERPLEEDGVAVGVGQGVVDAARLQAQERELAGLELDQSENAALAAGSVVRSVES